MSEPKPFASLSPSLLARKGGARPAMRPQLGALAPDALARQIDDLGWNDMGHDHHGHDHHGHELVPTEAEPHGAEVVAFAPAVAVPAKAPVPPVVKQQKAAARAVAASSPAASSPPTRGSVAKSGAAQRRSALADGRRAAFTLRVDADRHLKLRLACTINNCSAQQLLTRALDRLIEDLPEVDELAAQVARRRKSS